MAIVTIDRPEKLNTLNEAVIAGIAESVIDGQRPPPRSAPIVLRGAGRAFTAGYDLDFGARDPGFRTYRMGSPPGRAPPGSVGSGRRLPHDAPQRASAS